MKTQVLNLKSFVFIFLTVLLIFGMKGTVYGQKLNVGKPRTVRMIYFLPNDLPFRTDVVQKMRNKIRTVQTFYAEQMQAHGYGKKAFRFETNAKGRPVVHRVNGQYPFSHYDNTLGNAVLEELEQAFDFNVNIYFIVLGADALRQGNGQPAGGVADQRGKNGGHLLVPNRFEWGTVAHELGHTFGLGHDFRDNSYIMSYGHQYSALSACAAEFLSVHPYFNPRIPIAEVSPPIIELISSPTYPAGAKSIPVRLKVEDPNGVHQVQLFAWGGLQKCRGLAGKKESVIEFEYDGGVGLLDFDANLVDFTSLSDVTPHNILVNVVDTDGNVSKKHFLLWEDSPSLITTLKIESFLDDEVFELRGATAFSPDGTLLASTSGGPQIKLWDVKTRMNITALSGHMKTIPSVAFSPDGAILASAGDDGLVMLWNVSEAIRDHGPAVTAHVTGPPMYWIDKAKGTLHSLVGPEVESLVPSVHNAISLAVDTIDEKLYWAEKTGNRTGKIRRANLDGRNVQLVKNLTSVPLDIALDTTDGKLYLTNAWGKLQRLNLDGSNFQPNLIRGLKSPNHLALDVQRGKVYWTEQTDDNTGKVQSANLDGSDVRLVKDLASPPRSLAIDAANRKLYLTSASGKIQRMTLAGSYFRPNLITGLGALGEITVDTASRKLYWTESGRIRRANFNGENIQDIVTGLGAPADIALGVMSTDSVPAAPATIATPEQTLLLSNYPNPFNPETWIPYQLAEAADVTLTIYAVNGQIVRRLAFGHQLAGIYQTRSRAAYWDGRNALGESVASGVFFYTLTAGNFTATRKMLILK